MNGPDVYPEVAERLAERRELMRRAYLSAIERARLGQYVDPHYLQTTRIFVAANPPLGGALSTGEPA
jgi:hypothetical protein